MFDVREDVLPAEAAVVAEPDIRRGTIPLDELEVGMVRTLAKVIGDREIALFGEVSSDLNPVHHDEAYARGTTFGGRIAHGMLTAALISAVIGEQLPGHGTIYLKQSLTFLAPVRPGDRVEARVEVREIDMRRGRATLDCRCSVGDTVVLKGEALVKVPRGKTI